MERKYQYIANDRKRHRSQLRERSHLLATKASIQMEQFLAEKRLHLQRQSSGELDKRFILKRFVDVKSRIPEEVMPRGHRS